VNRPETPECDKLSKVADESQRIGEFLDWCSERGWHLAEYVSYTDLRDERLVPLRTGIQEVLARHFGIDLNKVDQEKRALLEWIRSQHDNAEATS